MALDNDRLITIAIHTYEKAIILKDLLENEGIPVVIHNVNLSQPAVSSGVRVRINEKDLPMALKIIEETELYVQNNNKLGDSESSQQNKILIPIDFSEYSMKACRLGFDFAKTHKASITLLHSYITPSFTENMALSDAINGDISDSQLQEQLHYVATEEMKRFVANLQSKINCGELPAIKIDKELRAGVPEDVILDYSKEINPIIIIMGTRGKSKKETELIGSVTAEVLDSSKYPIFTIPEDTVQKNISQFKRVAFFTNLNQQDLISLEMFIRLFGKFKPDINLIHFADKKEIDICGKLDKLKEYCTNQYPQLNFSIQMIKVDKLLKNVENNLNMDNVDMILVPNKKKNIFARLFNPSIAHKILFKADTPMVVIPL